MRDKEEHVSEIFFPPKGFPLEICAEEPRAITVAWDQLLLNWERIYEPVAM